MPTCDTHLATDQLARVLIYGAAKTKKTWWACQAAEAGFNVLLLDGENGAGILKQLSPAARKRIYILDLKDVPNQAKMAVFMARFCTYKKFWWHEAEKRPMGRPTDGFIEIDAKKLTPNTVVVLDSHTALAWSLAFRYAIENSIDLSQAEKQEWDGYGQNGILATWILHQLSKLPCHFIMIGHADQYDKMTKVRKGEKSELIFSRMQIKSTSRPHAMQIAEKFSDVFYFSVKGSAFKIDTTSGDNRDGGSRSVNPKVYSWDDLPFATVCKSAGIALPASDSPVLKFESSNTGTPTKSANATTAPIIDVPESPLNLLARRN